MPCQTQPCPVDCIVSDWSSWTSCTVTCGAGKTTRSRAIVGEPAEGGKACPAETRQEMECNKHRCGRKFLPVCHHEHVTCAVQNITMPNSRLTRPDLPGCAWSKVEDTSRCWNNFHRDGSACDLWDNKQISHNCHRPDTDAERALAKRHPTVAGFVVTHGRKHMPQGGSFYCDHNGHQCSCTCDKHPPCCMAKQMLAVNELLPGSSFEDAHSTLQDCCNLCTNHPLCTAWEFSIDGSSRVCVLKQGAPQFVDVPAGGGARTWAGQPSGTMFPDQKLSC